jgi:glycosyltransferase involved in cell wall biosynthesis
VTIYPRVAIGIPVYNGGSQLTAAVESILQQRFADIEIIICDNCSTDRTSEIGRAFALRDKRIRYYRNESNVGPGRNFGRVLELAKAPSFLWAAHDDLRESEYVGALVDALEAAPGAALATGRCRFTDATGREKPEWGIAPSASGDPIEVAQTLLKSHTTHWIYGIFRTAWLREHIRIISDVDPWGGDLLFLLGMALDGLIVGSDNAVLKKEIRYNSPFRPQTPREVVAWNVKYIRSLVKIIEARDLDYGRRILVYRAAINHYRTHFLPHDLRVMFLILTRAAYHTLIDADRP